MTSAKGAFGTLLKIGNGATTEVFTTVAEVIGDIAGPNISQDTIEVTSHSSASRMKEYIAGLADAGELSFEINWVDGNTQHELLLTKVTAGASANFQVVWPDTSQAAFAAFVTALSRSADQAAQLKAQVTLKITGAITWS